MLYNLDKEKKKRVSPQKGEENMKRDLIINEEIYKNYKSEISKENDYFTQNELQNLMQFLMQRQEKVIKNEEKIQKIIFWQHDKNGFK